MELSLGEPVSAATVGFFTCPNHWKGSSSAMVSWGSPTVRDGMARDRVVSSCVSSIVIQAAFAPM